MDAIAPPTDGRVLGIVATLLGATHMFDFIFYGMHAHDALAGIGMGLIAHSAWHGGFGKAVATAATATPAGAAGQATGGAAARAAARARTASVLGVSLVIASIFAKYALRGFAWA
ncbi:MAG: hypothetical protein ACTHOC_11385 [Luteimonas sp.]